MTSTLGQKYALSVDAADYELRDLVEVAAAQHVAEMWGEAVRAEGYEPREFLGVRVRREGMPWTEEVSTNAVEGRLRPAAVYYALGRTSKGEC